MGVIRWKQNVKNKKRGHPVTGGLKMGVNVAAHTRHTFLGSAPPGVSLYPSGIWYRETIKIWHLHGAHTF